MWEPVPCSAHEEVLICEKMVQKFKGYCTTMLIAWIPTRALLLLYTKPLSQKKLPNLLPCKCNPLQMWVRSNLVTINTRECSRPMKIHFASTFQAWSGRDYYSCVPYSAQNDFNNPQDHYLKSPEIWQFSFHKRIRSLCTSPKIPFKHCAHIIIIIIIIIIMMKTEVLGREGLLLWTSRWTEFK